MIENYIESSFCDKVFKSSKLNLFVGRLGLIRLLVKISDTGAFLVQVSF